MGIPYEHQGIFLEFKYARKSEREYLLFDLNDFIRVKKLKGNPLEKALDVPKVEQDKLPVPWCGYSIKPQGHITLSNFCERLEDKQWSREYLCINLVRDACQVIGVDYDAALFAPTI